MTGKKVALVSDWFLSRMGGVERHMVELARGLQARGHEVEIVTATPELGQVAELPGVAVRRLDCPLLPGYGTVFRPRDGARLAALFSDRGYDLIHAHSIYSPLALAAAAAGRSLRLPTVLTAHSLIRYACIPVFRALDYRLMWSSWPAVLTAVSEAVAADLRRASFAAEVHVLPNGITLGAPIVRRGDETIRIVSVMRLVPRKRPAALLSAFASLEARLGRERARRCRLVVLGGGPLFDELRALATRLHLADRVELRGWATPAEVQTALAAADVFALPTRKEAFGLAAIEAAATGLPVVVMRGSGAGELFTPGFDGMVAGSDEDLGAALAQLACDRALRERIGFRARELAERFAWDGILDRTLTLYRLAERRMSDRSGAALTEPLRGALQLVAG